MGKLIATLVCDDVREEKSGKLTIVGLYNRDITFHSDTSSAKLALPKLCIVQRWEGASETESGYVELVDPTGTVRKIPFQVKPNPDNFSNVMMHVLGPILVVGKHLVRTFVENSPVDETSFIVKCQSNE